MSANLKKIVLMAGMTIPLVSHAQLKDTGTVDALIQQGQVEYQLQQQEIKDAAKRRTEPGAPTPSPEAKPAFDFLMERSGTVGVKEYVDRLNFVGVFLTDERRKAEIYYKGSSSLYREGDSLPRGFDLARIFHKRRQVPPNHLI